MPNEYPEKGLSQAQSYGSIKDLIGSHIVYATVKASGEDILESTNFSFTLNQKAASHHQFELICSAEEFNEQNNYPLENSRKLLGKRLSIHLHQFSQIAFTFTGIITGLTNKKINGHSKVILSGESPTILLENGKDCQSYEKKTLTDIIKSATKEYPSDLIRWDIQSRFQEPLHYTVQYKESDFEFIKRLTTRYGEWFYYDGERINIGGYGGKMTEMLETQDFFEFELKMKLLPQKFSYISYDSKQGKNHTVDSDSVKLQRPINPYLVSALQASEEIYTKTPLSLYNHSLMESGESELRSAVTREKHKRQNAVYLEAKSGNPNLNIGDLVKMNAWMPEFTEINNGEVPLETYRITEITHYYESSKGYKNEFIGVPKDNSGPPYTDEDAIPIAGQQTAVVTDNFDPEGYGRVRVQFPWQIPANQKSPWIRLIQPHAGGGKGFNWKPEIGDEVMIEFENNNAEKPFVSGNHYNGKQKSGYETPNNDKKIIKTRSGHLLILDDTQEKLSISLTDSAGNLIYFDTMEKGITLSAPETIKIIAKNLKIEIEETIETKAKDIQTTSKNDITQHSGGYTYISSGTDTHIFAGKVLDLYGKRQLIGYTDGKTELGAKQQMHVYGGDSLITAYNKIEYKAPDMNMLPQSGEFLYTKEKKIISMYWINLEMKKIRKFRTGEKLNLLIQTRNYEEGEQITIQVKEKEGKEIKDKQNEISLTGTIQADGTALLKEQVEIGDYIELPKEKTEEELQQEEEQEENGVYKRYKGRDYTKTEWLAFEQQEWEYYQAQKKRKGFWGF